MKTIKQSILLMSVCTALALAGCSKNDEPAPVPPVLSPETITVEAGSSATAQITSGTPPFTVASSAPSSATAKINDRIITITAIAEGQAMLTVTGKDNATAKMAVMVSRKSANSPQLSAQAIEIDIDATATVAITGGAPSFTAVSSAPTVASVSVEGSVVTVKGIAGGTALITVSGSDKATATFAVSVSDEQILFGPDKTQLGNGQKRFTIKKSHTLKKGVYTMVGWIYVEEGATLTIEPGTIIKGSNFDYNNIESATGSSLIIKRGARIHAEGTPTSPIIFTSAKKKGQRQATDWGGIIICGKARNNQTKATVEGGIEADYGGDDDNDNSGTLRYVRIEFAGYPYALDNEINGLTLGSVGRGTTIDHIQVSYSGDDSFEWFGGTVNCKYLIAWHGWDDDFDTDFGYSGKLQFLLSVRDPKLADQSNSNSFESDNNADGDTKSPFTTVTFSNVTVIGPIGQDNDFRNESGSSGYINGYNWGTSTDAAYPIRPGIFQAALQIRRNSRLCCFNSVFAGFPVGLMLSNEKGNTQGAATDGHLKLKNIFFAGMNLIGADADKKKPEDWSGDFSSNYFKKPDLNNTVIPDIASLKLKHPFSKRRPLLSTGYSPNDPSANFSPTAGSPLLNAASFADALLNDAFFTKVPYVGAFASDSEADNWTQGWAEFDPQNADY
ncbi:MAG: hypothetical protein LBH04_03085 [Tannerellaceae bacterium]|jgi:hypothetical protein|nr:hypothetical protein [Tannerellaceae bacterium]